MAYSLLPRKIYLVCVLSAGLLACAGCGGPAVAEVSGTVKIKGAPASDVVVYFIPDGEKGTVGQRAAAVTDSEGRFQLKIGKEGKGAVVGHHRVVLIDRLSLSPVPDDRPEMAKTQPRGARPSRIPEKYNAATTTPLRAQVEPDQKTIELEIQ